MSNSHDNLIGSAWPGCLNKDFNEWDDAFPNKLLGVATLDRLRHRAYQVVLDGKSYRAPRPVEQASEGPVGKESKTTK